MIAESATPDPRPSGLRRLHDGKLSCSTCSSRADARGHGHSGDGGSGDRDSARIVRQARTKDWSIFNRLIGKVLRLLRRIGLDIGDEHGFAPGGSIPIRTRARL